MSRDLSFRLFGIRRVEHKSEKNANISLSTKSKTKSHPRLTGQLYYLNGPEATTSAKSWWIFMVSERLDILLPLVQVI